MADINLKDYAKRAISDIYHAEGVIKEDVAHDLYEIKEHIEMLLRSLGLGSNGLLTGEVVAPPTATAGGVPVTAPATSAPTASAPPAPTAANPVPDLAPAPAAPEPTAPDPTVVEPATGDPAPADLVHTNPAIAPVKEG